MIIWFDMDGTIADLYSVENWLENLEAHNPEPYALAPVMLNMSKLARWLHKLQSAGIEIGIISWTSRSGNDLYNGQVALEKLLWLHKHLPSVNFDSIQIVQYGTPKSSFKTSQFDILFDDEERNREDWGETAYEPGQIFEIIKDILSTD